MVVDKLLKGSHHGMETPQNGIILRDVIVKDKSRNKIQRRFSFVFIYYYISSINFGCHGKCPHCYKRRIDYGLRYIVYILVNV